MERYSRQIALEDFSAEAQKNLGRAKIVLIGAGGVASAALPLLAGAGVGEIALVDFDSVSLSNLHRQTIYKESDVGKNKAKIAAEKFSQLNSDVKITPIILKIENAGDLSEILQGANLCIDASDSFKTRFIVSDACGLAKLSLIMASAQEWVSQNVLFGKNFYLRDFLEDENAADECAQKLAIFPPAAHLSGVWAAGFALRFLALKENFYAGSFQQYSFKTNKFFQLRFK